MFALVKTFYIIELVVLTVMLYAFGAFVHLSFDVRCWSMYTRIILAVLFLLIVIYSQYIAAVKGLKR